MQELYHQPKGTLDLPSGFGRYRLEDVQNGRSFMISQIDELRQIIEPGSYVTPVPPQKTKLQETC